MKAQTINLLKENTEHFYDTGLNMDFLDGGVDIWPSIEEHLGLKPSTGSWLQYPLNVDSRNQF